MITKEKFCDYINWLHFTYVLCEPLDYVKEITAIAVKLRKDFPPVDGFCEIEHYVQCEFGKPPCEYSTPEELYEGLIKQQKL